MQPGVVLKQEEFYSSPPSTQTRTKLELGPQKCNDPDHFDDHFDVLGSTVKTLLDIHFCVGDEVMMDNTTAAVTWDASQSYLVDRYYFEVEWVRGCVTDVEKQSILDPLGEGFDPETNNPCSKLLYENWEKCRHPNKPLCSTPLTNRFLGYNGGVGGSRTAGCLKYSFSPK
jgi:hypothetical protein